MNLKRLGLISVAITLLASSFATMGAQAAPEDKSVYIVKFKDNVSLGDEISATRRSGVSVTQVLEHAFKGFIGEMTAAQATALARNPRIAIIEEDFEVQLLAPGVQNDATWGIDRIDERLRVLDKKFSYPADGTSVTVYVVDTGILSGHSEFNGRVKTGYSKINDGRGTEDCNGHGTHVAGTIGGANYGVAQNVNLVPVRVFGCTGGALISDIVSGLDWIAKDKTSSSPSVVNMSLGGSASTALDDAVKGLVLSGVPVVVAAGNSNRDACSFSPARVLEAITVGATGNFSRRTTEYDARASYSNFGRCLDLFAPGSNIISAWHTSQTALNAISGTSMASPHVAGAVAIYLDMNPTATPNQVAEAIRAAATKDVVVNAGKGSPNYLIFVG